MRIPLASDAHRRVGVELRIPATSVSGGPRAARCGSTPFSGFTRPGRVAAARRHRNHDIGREMLPSFCSRSWSGSTIVALPRPGTRPRKRSARHDGCCAPGGGRRARVRAAAPAGSAPTGRCAPARPPAQSAAPPPASRSSEAAAAPYPPPSPHSVCSSDCPAARFCRQVTGSGERPGDHSQPDEGRYCRPHPPLPPPRPGRDLLSHGHCLVADQPGEDGEQRSETGMILRQRFLDPVKRAPLAGRQAHHAPAARRHARGAPRLPRSLRTCRLGGLRVTWAAG